MLSSHLRQHQVKQQELRERNEERKKAAQQAVNHMSHVLLDSVNVGVANVFANQKVIDAEVKALQQQTTRFARQTTQWLDLIGTFNQSLKELGDVENWAKTIEYDMQAISTFLEHRAQAVQGTARAGVGGSTGGDASVPGSGPSAGGL